MKHTASEGPLGKGKRPHVNHSLAAKLEVVVRHRRGQSRRQIFTGTGIATSTIHYILKKEQDVLQEARRTGLLTEDGGGRGKKRKRGKYSLATKLRVLQLHGQGSTKTEISNGLGIPLTTVGDMIKAAKKIRAAARTHPLGAAPGDEGQGEGSPAVEEGEQEEEEGSSLRHHKKHCRLPLDLKLKVLRRLEEGQRIAQVSREVGLAPSSVQEVRKRAMRIRQAARHRDQARRAGRAEGVQRQQQQQGSDLVVESMERLLKIWMEKQVGELGALSDRAIQAKAKALWSFVWDSLAPEETQGLAGTFTASEAWLHSFKERCSLHPLPPATPESGRTTPATPPSPPSPRLEEACPVPGRGAVAEGPTSVLRAAMKAGRYSPRQVLALGEVRLPWRRPLPGTGGDGGEVPLQARDQFSLLLGGNATGELKLQPLVVYHTACPPSLRGYVGEQFPVLWRPHPQGRVVAALCRNYVAEQLSPRCREYALANGLPDRFLLLVEAGPLYPPSMEDWADNLKVMFLPPGDGAAVPPPPQHGLATVFRLCYLRHLLQQLLRDAGGQEEAALQGFWGHYHVRSAICNVAMAWQDLTAAVLNATWHGLWPECVGDLHSLHLLTETTQQQAVETARLAGLPQVTAEDVLAFAEDPGPALTCRDVCDLQELHDEQDGQEDGQGGQAKTLEGGVLGRVLALFEEAMALLEQHDPHCGRSCEVRSSVEQAIAGYRQLHHSNTHHHTPL